MRNDIISRRGMLTGLAGLPLLTGIAAASTDAVTLAPLARAAGWIGERPSLAHLRGRVVLVDVFTFECINCTNVTPNLKRLYRRYARADLEIIGVHTPEVPSYQTRLAYLERQTQAAALPWPIAIDNDSRIWDAYGVSAWPTQLLFDRSGRLRATIVGDGLDARVDETVASLVR